VTVPSTRRRFDPDALAELEEQRNFLLRSLQDLDDERAAGDLAEADYQMLHDDYTARAAEVLRSIDEGRASAAGSGASPRRGRRLIAVVVVAAVAGSAGLAVAAASGTRLPGDNITGDIRETPSSQLTQAATLAQQGEVAEALRLYDEVLEGDPANVEALSERGLLLVSLASATQRPALAARGRESIEQALTVDADNARALFYLGLALRLEGDDPRAADAFTAALAADPPPALRQAMEDFLASIAEGQL
jgi:tetratricopeptide (TPR) repeat protein